MPENTAPDDPNPSVFVFAPSPLLTVTVECAPDGSDELHVRAGGQGFRIARMAATLGVDVILCGVFGGETGRIVRHLPESEGISVAGSTRPVPTAATCTIGVAASGFPPRRSIRPGRVRGCGGTGGVHADVGRRERGERRRLAGR